MPARDHGGEKIHERVSRKRAPVSAFMQDYEIFAALLRFGGSIIAYPSPLTRTTRLSRLGCVRRQAPGFPQSCAALLL